MIDISRRQWDQVIERISRLESKIRSLESKVELLEKKMKPSEIYRMVKHQEQEEAGASRRQTP